jgi:cell division protein FtsW
VRSGWLPRRGDTGDPLTPALSPMWWIRRPAGPFYLLLGCTGILLILGLTMVLSASSVNALARYGSPYAVAAKQATWAAIGLPLGWVASRLTARAYRRLAYPILLVALLLALVLVGGDLGTSIVIVAILGAMLFLAGARMRIFAIFGATTLASFLAMIAIEPYRLARVAHFFNPSADPSGAGYQGLQGHYALAGGGWWGVGLGASREKWGLLPEAHTDFIFAVIGEELGLAGSLCVLGVFVLLAYAGFRVATESTDPFVQLAAGTATTWLTVQTLVNVGAVIGMVPITGIPLPLISYGGSALVLNLVTVGMLISFARTNIRPRRQSRG